MTGINRQIGEPLDTDDAIAIGNSRHLEQMARRPEPWIDTARTHQQNVCNPNLRAPPKPTDPAYAQLHERYQALQHAAMASLIQRPFGPDGAFCAWQAEREARWKARTWQEKFNLWVSVRRDRIRDAWAVLTGKADIGEW